MQALNHAFTVARKHPFKSGRTVRAMAYGERLAEALTLAKRSRRELAAALDISVQAVGQVVTSTSSALTAENSAKAARYLNVDHHWLATGEGEPRPRPLISPMGYDLARVFDAKTPTELRDTVYAQAVGLIDLGARSSQPRALPADQPPTAGLPRT